MKTLGELRSIVDQTEFENYEIKVFQEGSKIYLQAIYMEPDIVTQEMLGQYTRKWLLSLHMTKSEVVQTVFKCCLTSMEHRTRESFKYRGKRIFGPHFDVDGLWELCANQRFDVREEAPK